MGMKMEMPESVTEKKRDRNVEKTQGGGAAVAAKQLGAPRGSAEDAKDAAKRKVK